MSNLFRSESVAFSTRRLDGDVILAQPLSTRLLTLLAVIVLTAITLFVSTATFARKETVVGWLTPEQGVMRAVATHSGVIESFAVEEAQFLPAGGVIARVRRSADYQSGPVGQAVLDALSRQAEAALVVASSQQAQLRNDEQRLRARLDGLTDELDRLNEQLAFQVAEVGLADEDVARVEVIAQRGYVSTRELNSRQSVLLSAQRGLASLRQDSAALEQERTETSAQLDAIPVRMEAAAADAASAQAVLDERTVLAEAQNSYTITSPIDARVAAILQQEGRAVAAGQAIAVLLPDGDMIVAELFVPTRAVGFIRPGQEVRLAYEAFPHQRFGVGRGEIIQVSQTVLAPSEISVPGLLLNEPVFRVRARLERQQIEAYGEQIALQPGLLLSADIVLERRSLIEWAFDPIFAAGRR